MSGQLEIVGATTERGWLALLRNSSRQQLLIRLLVFLGCYDYCPCERRRIINFTLLSVSAVDGHFRHITNCAFLGERVLSSLDNSFAMVKRNLKRHVRFRDEMGKSFYLMEFRHFISSIYRRALHVPHIYWLFNLLQLIGGGGASFLLIWNSFQSFYFGVTTTANKVRPARALFLVVSLLNCSWGREIKATHFNALLVGFPWVALLCLVFLLF